MPAGSPGLKSPWLGPMMLCGQHSLEIFALGVFLAFTGYFVLMETSAGLALHILVGLPEYDHVRRGVAARLVQAAALKGGRRGEPHCRREAVPSAICHAASRLAGTRPREIRKLLLRKRTVRLPLPELFAMMRAAGRDFFDFSIASPASPLGEVRSSRIRLQVRVDLNARAGSRSAIVTQRPFEPDGRLPWRRTRHHSRKRSSATCGSISSAAWVCG